MITVKIIIVLLYIHWDLMSLLVISELNELKTNESFSAILL